MARKADIGGRMRKYWATWRQAKDTLAGYGGFDDAEIEQERHECHKRALGEDPSSRDIVRDWRKFNAVLQEFEAIANPDDFNTQLAREQQADPREQVIYAIRQLGLSDAYLDKIARDVFQLAPWHRLNLTELNKLRYTATSRARAKAKRILQ